VIERLNCHLTRDCGKLPQEFTQRMPALQVVDEIFEWNSRHPNLTLYPLGRRRAGSGLISSSGPSAPRQRQPESNHLVSVAHQQAVTHQHRVVPGLALQSREVRNLRELVGCGFNQREFTLLGKHQ